MFDGTWLWVHNLCRHSLVVASMTEGELAGTEMKEFPMSCLGCPGQHYEAGKVFGCLVRVGELSFFMSLFVAEKPPKRQSVFAGISDALVDVYSSV
jgi:hypothetical protein